jgi:hypothetical protein
MATTVIVQSQDGDGAISGRNHDDDDVCWTSDSQDVDVDSSNKGRANDKNGVMTLADGIESVTNRTHQSPTLTEESHKTCERRFQRSGKCVVTCS